jgi:hypothetical protein
LGDFNIDLLNSNNCNQLFLNTLLSNGFYPTIDRPTRIRDASATLIDNIFVNIHNSHIDSSIWLADISDHLPIYITLPYEHNSKPKNAVNCISKRKYSEEQINAFREELTRTDWTSVYLAEGTQNKFNIFSSTITMLHDKFFPQINTKIKFSSTYKPWLTSSILNSIKKKNNLYKKLLKSKSPELKTKYLKYKNKLVSVIRMAEKNYYTNKLLEVKDNVAKTWKVMNEMIGRGPARNTITQIKSNDSIIDEPEEIANKFNEFFVNVGPDLAKEIPPSNKRPSDFLKGNFPDSMYISPTNEFEIMDIIKNLRNTNSKGSDDLPLSLIKTCDFALSPILTYLNNESFLEGVFPDSLKIAKVIPVHKSGDVKCISNYRPISILSTFSKISEKLIATRLNKYLLDKSILRDNQYGFREKLSTSMALLKLTDDISKSIDDGNVTVGVFIDLAKAFDTVDHSILLKKLAHYGIRGVANDWFCSYLTNRRQYVRIGKFNSVLSLIKCGVPQGSILGPILFLIYINDLNQISEILHTIMFADDTNLFLSGKNAIDVESQFNRELVLISEWFNVNLLSLNVKKTSYMVFSNARNSRIDILLAGSKINQVYETRFLGVIISSKLNWNAHIDTVLNKISKTIGIIAKVRHLLPTSATRTLYLCLVEPYISYCNIVWAQSKPTTQLDKILRVQKKYCRLITFADYRAHSEPLFKQLLILNVYKIHIYQLSLFMYKQLNKLLPSAGTFSFQTNSVVHSHFTRQSENLYLVRCRTQRRLTTVLFQGPRLWNSLPSRLKKSPSVNVFKRLAKVMLLA